jgi:hypothetical protein
MIGTLRRRIKTHIIRYLHVCFPVLVMCVSLLVLCLFLLLCRCARVAGHEGVRVVLRAASGPGSDSSPLEEHVRPWPAGRGDQATGDGVAQYGRDGKRHRVRPQVRERTALQASRVAPCLHTFSVLASETSVHLAQWWNKGLKGQILFPCAASGGPQTLT